MPAWLKENRDEKQTPLLLPDGDKGRRRAEKIQISNVAARGYAEPSAGSETSGIPQDLLAAWAARDVAANQVPPPEFAAPRSSASPTTTDS